MGGWLTLIGDVPDFQDRFNKFRKIFSVEGVPDLRVETFEEIRGIKTICWAWNKHGIPDVFVKTKGYQVLVLCGVITDLGNYGLSPFEQREAAAKVFQLWNKHGEKVIGQLNGSFSCLFFDSKKNQATIFTDRFASRSVWMTEEDGIWIIGNFPSAIAVMQKESLKLDPVGLWSLFHAGRHVGIHGLYTGVNALLAGEKAVLSLGDKKINKWWERKYQPENGLSQPEWGNRLAYALTER